MQLLLMTTGTLPTSRATNAVDRWTHKDVMSIAHVYSVDPQRRSVLKTLIELDARNAEMLRRGKKRAFRKRKRENKQKAAAASDESDDGFSIMDDEDEPMPKRGVYDGFYDFVKLQILQAIHTYLSRP
jgi:hypothetical protein